MDKSLLVKAFGFPATLIHGDPMTLDRWLWLREKLPRTRNGERLLDLGCGTGAFTIGAALRGYEALGLSWDERNQRTAAERARICSASSARFEVQDLRKLTERQEFIGAFDVVIACEVIEHILDDRGFLRAAAATLKPGGKLLLTTPNNNYVPVHPSHSGPFLPVEDGGHVRRGYSVPMLQELCADSGLKIGSFSSCSGPVSQGVTAFYVRTVGKLSGMGWAATMPLRPLPPLLDPLFKNVSWPAYSLCLEAYKPRFS